MSSGKQMHMFHLTFFRVGNYAPNPMHLVVKRFAGVLLSSAAFVVLLPALIATAIAIKVCDGGPIFYGQDCLTKVGKVFTMHKFRSMRVDAERDSVARLSTDENDDRITSVDIIIRKLRIDELP